MKYESEEFLERERERGEMGTHEARGRALAL